MPYLCILCGKQALYDYSGQRPKYCGKHKEPEMINVVSKKCEYPGCGSLNPSFNYPDQTKGKYCGKHKEPEMINVLEKRKCEYPGCRKQPFFNYPDETKGRFCGKHKEPEMIDVVSKKCKHGLIFNTCKECQTYEQLLNNKKICITCSNKMLSNERIRAGIRKCAECAAADGDKTKPERTEHTVRRQLLELVKFPPSATDDIYLGGKDCRNGSSSKESLRRPDIMWQWTDRAIIFENDEDSHFDRETSCELAKITDQSHFVKNLLGEYAHVFLLRLNPDAYNKGRVYLTDRIKAVAEDINLFLELPKSELNLRYPVLVPNVGYYYYHNKAQKHIDAAVNQPNAMNVYKAE